MEINVPVLRKALDHVTAHPEEWDQANWAVRYSKRKARRVGCGTAYCLAGTIAIQAGHDMVWRDYGGGDGAADAGATASGISIMDAALAELGVTKEQYYGWVTKQWRDNDAQNDLFAGSNTLRRIYTIASELTNGEIEVPVELPDGS